MRDDRPSYRKPGPQGQQYSFDHYDLPPGRRGLIASVLGERAAARLRSPLFASAALLLTGAIFAGIIIASYPESGAEGENVPVVKADTLAYRETPADPGGMDIPNRDTTIFSAMNNEKIPEKPPVENLLTRTPPAERLDAFANRASTAPGSVPPAAATPDEIRKIVAAETGAEGPVIPEPVAPLAEAPGSAKPPVIHGAGENPETVERLRSALEQEKQAQAPAAAAPVAAPAPVVSPAPVPPAGQVTGQAESAAKVEPASGLAVTAGDYYIQLGSISAKDGAASEWGKIKKANAGELEGLSYRVQEANLGARGTFYRIQAGPMSKESASSLCDSIKARKPGACLVTR